MRRRLMSFVIALIMATGFLASQAAALACSTQTVIVGGKMTVCTVCGTVVSCM